MKKILILSYIPYPLNGGGQVAQFAILQVLQYKFEITFCAIFFNKELEKNIEPLHKLLPNVKFITAYNGVVGKAKRKGVLRTAFAIAQKMRRDVVGKNGSISVAKLDDFANPKTNTPFDYKSEHFIKQLHQIVRAEKYDIIQTEFHPFLELVNVFPTSAKSVFIAHESRTLRLKSFYDDSSFSSEFKDFIIKRNELAEIAMMKKYDAVVTFSEFDKALLELSGANNVHSIPFPIIDSEFLPNKKYQQPKKIVFIGNQGHVPNKEGLLWYIENCHEQCVAQYHLPLTVIGNWSISEDILKKYKNIEFVGSVESIDTYYEQSILIVPIFTGSGIRTKILYGMAKKVPLISTTFGCSGIPIEKGKHLFIADDAYGFINCIGNILSDNSQVQQMLNEAFEFVSQHYNQQAILEKRLALYNTLTITN